MDNSNNQQNFRQTDHLGVNKLGKSIKKSPLHQPNFTSPSRPQPQPQVYNINKNDFRNIVQQLTGSPAREPMARPPQNQPRPPNNRLQKVRPPPLAPTSRPPVQIHSHLPIPVAQMQPLAQAQPPNVNNYMRPPPPPTTWLSPTPTDVWTNTTESPISAYMRYLQNSIIDQGPRQPQSQPSPYRHPNPGVPMLSSPRFNGAPPLLASPRLNGPPLLLESPRLNGPPPALPSPRMHGPPPPSPSPNSQYLVPSPTGFWNLLSPRSPYPLLSPGYQYLPPISPGFSFSSTSQSGILGPGPPLPPSPGYSFPLSPSGFFPLPSPTWRE
ncbi:extensin-like [Dorcoceras hygrometricum]|uniref:Extensin-like n=1 Tax=Dorcoceras hygrometricum TaxID=472368 RepID=A0A2Z7D205_9LAMI|nr:extensin-like [Dorcoceras hygrometricum]